MKRLKILFISLVSFAGMFCAMLAGCAYYLDLFEEEYTEWYSQDGSVSITSTLSHYSAFGYFTVNGIQVRAFFGIWSEGVVLYSAPNQGTLVFYFLYSEDLDIVTEQNGVSAMDESGVCSGELTGTRDGDVFHVTGMEVGFTQLGSFDLYSRKVDPASIDARDFVDCYWKSDDGLFAIDAYFDYSVWDVYCATLALNDESYYIAFVWRGDGRFELYDFEAYIADRESCMLLASGTYGNVGGQLTLYFEEDTTFALTGQTIELTASL